MGSGPHLSRREILASVPVLAGGAPLVALQGQTSTAPHGTIRGVLRDKTTGEPVAVKMRITDAATGQSYFPPSCIKTMPKRTPSGIRYFYAREGYEVAVPPGRYQIEVVRGICHEPVIREVVVQPGASHGSDFQLQMLWDSRAKGWYSGNTHTHYNVDIEESLDDRLRMVPHAEAVDVSVISYLIRNRLPYASNRIPIGRLPQFSRDGAILDMGEECRNNFAPDSIPNGYGHCLFLNIPRLVQPASTGLLSPDGKAADFPTVSMLCAEAQKLGGTTIWCHNGKGLEAPVAIALGVANALNIADGHPVEYDWYYRFLNCGLRLPISTGTDWWEYDHNRVFVHINGRFTYESWLAGLRAGRTFISNGPLIEFTVNGLLPGSVMSSSSPLRIKARAVSRVPFERLEVVRDGEVVASRAAVNQSAEIEVEADSKASGWVAARVAGSTRTRLGYPVFAHTNPVYVEAGAPSRFQKKAATELAQSVRDGMDLIRKRYSFASDADRALALGRFEEGRQFYAKWTLE
jgi:hypothetical protein